MATPDSTRKVFGQVKRPRRCQGQKFDLNTKTFALKVYRCFSRESRIVRVVPRDIAVNPNDTTIPQEMTDELNALDIKYADGEMVEKEWQERRKDIEIAYRRKIQNLEELHSYSGKILHLCAGCRATYEAKYPDKQLHFIDLKLA